MFPEYNRRSGRIYTLGDRITDCFLRSENATSVSISPGELPTPTSPEVLAVAAYLTWLARGSEVGKNPSWRGQNAIPAANLIPLDKLDPRKGEAIYTERCVTCHAADGQGVQIGDKKAGPLWGPDSWNDGAGAARIYTLAGMIRYSMPYLDPGNMTDEDAQHLAAYINSKPRPVYPFKDRDYRVEKLPPDAVYYGSVSHSD
jgi:thiosulfate dehydrogenase